MIHVLSKFEWQLMMDYTFVQNRIPENTPVNFRHVHTKGFLNMLHPKFDFNEDTLTCMRTNSPDLPINHAYYKEKVEEYYIMSGVSSHHILVATQTLCYLWVSIKAWTFQDEDTYCIPIS